MSRFRSNFLVSVLLITLLVSACQPEVIEVEKEVVVTQVVKEEVEVEKIVEVEVEKPTEDAIGFVDIAAGEPIHLAFMLPTTGGAAVYGTAASNAMEIAVKERGQIHGHDITITGEDSQCSAEGGQTAAQRVAADPSILGVIGTTCSGAMTAAMGVISSAGLSIISPSNTSPALSDPSETWEPGYYRTAHNDTFQGRMAAQFAIDELGATTAAAIHDGDPYTQGLAQVFVDVFAELGGTVTSFEAVNKGDTDMRSVLTTVAADSPDVLFFPIFQPEGDFIVAQSDEIPGLENTTLFGADGLLVAPFPPSAGDAAVGMYLSGPHLMGAAADAYQAKYLDHAGEPPPGPFGEHAYDGTNILMDAIEQVALVNADGSISVGRQALRDAITATRNFAGITGKLSCADKGINKGDCATGEALAIFQITGEDVASEDAFPPKVFWTPVSGTSSVVSARDSVRLGMNQELEFLNVMYTQGGNSLEASKSAQRGLLFSDQPGAWVGELALEVPSVDNGLVAADGSSVTYNLREGIKFHDGSDVTSADVKATWEAIMNPDNTPISRLGYEKIGSIDTPDDYTVVVNFAEPFPAWKILFDFIFPSEVIEANSPGLDESLAMRQPIGFGPYMIKKWRTGEYIEYEANPNYWQGAPAVERFFIEIFPSTEALLAALETGETDIAWGLRSANIPKLEELGKTVGVRLVQTVPAGGERYVMNADASQAPLFADRNVRVALQHAVDQDTIISDLLGGWAAVNPGTEWFGTPWAAPLERYAYDPGKSKELLADAGWSDSDGDGYLDKDGETLEFKHTTTAGVLQREQVQLVVQQQFKDVGVKMNIENGRSAELFGTYDAGGTWSHGAYEMAGWSHGLRAPDPEISNRFLCKDIAGPDNTTGAQWNRYCNPAVDELLIAASSEFDEAKKTELLHKAQQIMHDDAYRIFLFASGRNYGVAKGLQNFDLGRWHAWYGNMHNWYWSE